MPVEYSIFKSERIIYVQCCGELSIREITQYFKDIEAHASIPQKSVEIVDLTSIKLFDLGHNEAATMPQNYAAAKAKHEILGTIAFGANKLNQGFLSLIKAYFKREMPDHFFEIANSLTDAKRTARRLQVK